VRKIFLTAAFAVSIALGQAQEPSHEPSKGESHEEEAMPHELLWKWANFAILAGALGWLISKNAGPYFQSRSEEIRRGIEEAAKTRADAEARAAEIERRVSNLATEVEQIRAQSHAEISREGERVRAETEAQIQKIQAQAENEIQSAAKHATQDLKAFASQLAVQRAEEQIRARLTGPSQEELVSGFISELRGKAESH